MDIKSYEEIFIIKKLVGHNHDVYGVSFSLDGSLLACSSLKKSIPLHDKFQLLK